MDRRRQFVSSAEEGMGCEVVEGANDGEEGICWFLVVPPLPVSLQRF